MKTSVSLFLLFAAASTAFACQNTTNFLCMSDGDTISISGSPSCPDEETDIECDIYVARKYTLNPPSESKQSISGWTKYFSAADPQTGVWTCTISCEVDEESGCYCSGISYEQITYTGCNADKMDADGQSCKGSNP